MYDVLEYGICMTSKKEYGICKKPVVRPKLTCNMDSSSTILLALKYPNTGAVTVVMVAVQEYDYQYWTLSVVNFVNISFLAFKPCSVFSFCVPTLGPHQWQRTDSRNALTPKALLVSHSIATERFENFFFTTSEHPHNHTTVSNEKN